MAGADDSDDDVPALTDVDAAKVVDDDDDIVIPTPAPVVSPPLAAVPVTILTGFLGSGKTTLVRHILTSPDHGKRIAVIENEFGGGGESASLGLPFLSVETMIARDGTDPDLPSLASMIELPNGCVCCTVKDDLVTTLESLLGRRTDFDHIIIEASGMADPGPVASVLWTDAALESRVRLGGVVACVDARNLERQLGETYEAARQIAFADRIVVNKIDLLGDGIGKYAKIDQALDRIRKINPTAPTYATTFSNVLDLGWILDLDSFDPDRLTLDVPQFGGSVDSNHLPGSSPFDGPDFTTFCCVDPQCAIKHDATATTQPRPQHLHTESVSTIALLKRGSVDLRKMDAWLASVLWPDQDAPDAVLRARLERGGVESTTSAPSTNEKDATQQRIYRIKGILSVRHPLSDGLIGSESCGNEKVVIPASNDHVDEGLAGEHVNPANGSDDRRYVVQAVHDLWECRPGEGDQLRWKNAAAVAAENDDGDEEEVRFCKVIVIGRWLDEQELRRGFDSCFVSET